MTAEKETGGRRRTGGAKFNRKPRTRRRRVLSLVPSPEDPQGFYVRPWDHPSAYDLRNPVEESW